MNMISSLLHWKVIRRTNIKVLEKETKGNGNNLALGKEDWGTWICPTFQLLEDSEDLQYSVLFHNLGHESIRILEIG